MAPAEFTFVNITAAPDLSEASAKRVRGHITRKVFAARRLRRLAANTRSKSQDQGVTVHLQEGADVELPLAPLAHAGVESSSQQSTYLPVPLGFNLEQAPTENGRTVAAPNYLPSWSVSSRQSLHAKTRHNLTTDTIASVTSTASISRFGIRDLSSDQLFSNILAMAFGDKLLRRGDAWNGHMSTVAHLLAKERSVGMKTLPFIILNGVVLDTINYVFDFPRIYHHSVIEHIRQGDDPSLVALVNLTQNLRQWRQITQSRPSWKSRNPPSEAEESWMKLYFTCRFLQLKGNPHIRPAAKCIEIILRLHPSRHKGAREGLREAAGELKDLLDQWPVRTCPTMDLTSCYIWLGAVTSERGSKTRQWFVGSLRRAAANGTQQQLWDVMLGTLEKEFAQDGPEFLMCLREVWEEVRTGI